MNDPSSSASSPPFGGSSSVQSKQERLRQLRQEQQRLEELLRLQRFAASYEVELEWPAVIHLRGRGKDADPATDRDLIQHRLLEAGMLYEVPASLGQVTEATRRFVADLEQSQCFQSVHVQIGTTKTPGDGGAPDPSAPSSSNLRQLTVNLQEAKWYRLYLGGGVKSFGLSGEASSGQSESGAFLPTAELECSLSLRNLTGHLDATQFLYTLDSHSISSWRVNHKRPLYSVLPSPWREWVLGGSTGSQTRLEAQAALDTVDHEWTRSYKEFQRWLSVKVVDPSTHWSLEWSALGRDVVPRRHAHLPYCLAASPEIVAQAGPSVRHAFTLEYQPPPPPHSSSPTPGADAPSPWRCYGKVQIATPPGDVGFAKVEGGLAWDGTPPVSSRTGIQFQSSLRAGYLHSLTFGGRTPRGTSAAISDRFFVGGPLPLRGFGPSGIGPRARAHRYGAEAGGGSGGGGGPGDSLGGDLYYTAAFLASVRPFAERGDAATAEASSPDATAWSSLRTFAFLNVGTCVGRAAALSPLGVLRSTRAAAGVGLSTGALGPRIELAYAVPLRYDTARDIRKAFQLGVGASF